MAHCPSCDYPLPLDRERLGARCPSCRDPLYEPPGRVGRPAREGEGACAAHEGREAVGTCARCGNYFCEVCRTRWRGQVVCAACVERGLASREAAPEQVRAHLRQAMFGIGLGVAAWAVAALSILVIVVLAGASAPEVLVGLVVLAGFGLASLLASVGLGQAAAAIRTRGNHMILATIGLVLSGLYLGAFIGLFASLFWANT